MGSLEDIRSAITALSGSGKRVVGTRRHGIYSSFTLPGLDDMTAVRDTRVRFLDFVIPEDLTGKSVLDVGANVGAMTFEFLRRGANVVAVEYRDDRCSLMRAIARHYDLDERLVVYQRDFNDQNRPHRLADWAIVPEPPSDHPSWDPDWHRYDYVLCSSVDEYIDDLESFYDTLREVSRGGTLLLESNVQWDFDVGAVLERAGFGERKYLGNGHSGGISRKRKLWIAS